MPKINIKTDFTDGDNLYGQELNNNFNTIKAAFETTLEKVTTYTEDQIIAFDENGNLVDSGVSKSEVGTKTEINEKADKVASATNNNIATLDADGNLKDSGYNKETIKTWNDNSTDVKFFKGTSEQVDDQAITNGQLLYDTQTGETYLDAADIRIPTGGGTVIAVSTTQPTNPSTKLWINPDEDNATAASNVVDSMAGNEVDKSPSVHSVKNYYKKNIMTATLTDNIECSTSSTSQNIDVNQYTKIGEKLTIDANGAGLGIKIGSGITTVLVSAQICVENTHDAEMVYNLYVKRNATNVSYTRKVIAVGRAETISLPSMLFTCSEGDVFSISIYKGSAAAPTRIQSGNNRTFMTVEVVE